jgi:hypothetical protein
MSSSSNNNNRAPSLVERRIANENATARPRDPSGQQGGTRSEKDPRRPQSPQASASGSTHRRAVSSSQRTRGGIEERRTERVQVTTRETLTSRTRSPERRPAPPVQHQERTRPSEVGRSNSGDHRPRPSKTDAIQGTLVCRFQTVGPLSDSVRCSSVGPGSVSSTPYDRASSVTNLYTSACVAGSSVLTTPASP